MDEQELWGWIAEQMKIDEVPNPVREEAVEEGFVDDALAPAAKNQEKQELLNFARKRMRFARKMEAWRQGRHPIARDEDGGVSPDSFTLEDTESEALRAAALEAYLAKIAACERVVFDFRERFLDGGLLTPEQARALISSPAAAYLFMATLLLAT